MPFFDPIRIGASGTVADYTVDRSLRFNKSDLAYLGRTPSSTGNQKVWTWSCWFKRTKLADSSYFISSYGNNDGIAAIYFDNSDRINTYYDTSGANPYGAVNERRYRDVGAWMHLVWQVDALNTTQRIWINGVEESLSSSLNPPNYAYTMNQSGQLNAIGNAAWYTSGTGSNMYLAECYFSDGFKYTPSDFAETNSITGQWIPKSPSISYGTNGFYLNFSDNSGTTATTLGKDSSGNGNNFTPNNFAVSDAVKDSPTNNFCTWNPLENFDNVALSEGNLRANGVAGFDMIKGNMGVSSGKWYFEIEADAIYANTWSGGIHELYPNPNYAQAYWYANYYTAADYGHVYAVMDNNYRCTNGSRTTFTSDITAGDIIGFRLDLDNNELSISVNGTDKGKLYDIQGGVTYTPAQQGYTSSSKAVLNCGQDSTFAGAVSSGGNTDANGIGDFKYAVPSGYKAICSANLPDPTILLPNKHFDTLLYSGTGSSQNITGLEYQPDWVWIKSRSTTTFHNVYDTLRLFSDGTKERIYPNGTNAGESATYSGTTNLTAFNSNGFTVGDGADTNANGQTYVAWNWNAGDTDGKTYAVTVVSDSGNKYRFDGFGTSAVTLDLAEGGTYIFNYPSAHPFRFSTTSDGTHGGGSEYTTGVTHNSSTQVTIVVAASAPTLYYYCSSHSGMGGQVNTNSTLGSSNFDGTIQSTAKVNASAGFSIVTFSGSGNRTIGHGLGVAPKAIIMKGRNVSDQWTVGHQELDASNPWHKGIPLNTTASTQDNATFWNDTAPTSTVFSKGSWNENYNMIAYVFSEVAGYSKFGKYTGNGNADGTFVFTGFRPAFVLFKKTDTNGFYWEIRDNKRDSFNASTRRLFPNTSDQENSSESMDFLSNGFKLRNSGSGGNANSGSYIYLCFAESPFKNARAR